MKKLGKVLIAMILALGLVFTGVFVGCGKNEKITDGRWENKKRKFFLS